MSPLGAVTTAEGRLKVSFVSPATPGRPSVMSTVPSGLNLVTVWPLPSFPSVLAPQRSNTHTLPLRSTSTALVEPQGRLSFAQPCSAEYDVRSSGARAEGVGPAHADMSATSVAHAIGFSNLSDSKYTVMALPKRWTSSSRCP